MKKFLSLIISFMALLAANAQEEGTYCLYAYDKTNSANIYIPLTSTDGDMYSATGYTFNSSTDLSGIQVVYGNWEKTYAPATDTWPEVKLGSVVTLEESGTGSAWVYGWTLAESNYVFFQLSTMKLAISENETNPITGTSGISGVNTERESEAIYFNMQGVRENKRLKGVYIKKEGNKTSRVMVK